MIKELFHCGNDVQGSGFKCKCPKHGGRWENLWGSPISQRPLPPWKKNI